MTYTFQSSDTKLLRRLRASRAAKVKSGYSIDATPMFVAESLHNIIQDISGNIAILSPSYSQTLRIRDLNLIETDEAIKFVQIKITKQKLAEAQK